MCQTPEKFWMNVENELQGLDHYLTQMINRIRKDPAGCAGAKAVALLNLQSTVSAFTHAHNATMEANKTVNSYISYVEKAPEN